MFVVREKEVGPWCPLQPVSETRPFTTSAKHGSDEFFEVCGENENNGKQDGVKKSAEIKKKCVVEVARDICLRRRKKQALSDTVGARKRAARERLISLFGYDLTERWPRAEDGTELG